MCFLAINVFLVMVNISHEHLDHSSYLNVLGR